MISPNSTNTMERPVSLIPAQPIGRRSLRKIRTDDTVRDCAVKSCDTVLSRYNTAEYCFLHEPKKPPRIRGTTR